METKGFSINSPLIESPHLSKILGFNSRVLLKMDCMQPSGSFKIRGIGYCCSKKVEEGQCKHFVTASGGNAGVATAYSGHRLGVPTTVVIPTSTPSLIKTKLEDLGAKVILHGNTFDDANELALKIVKEDPTTSYIHPYDDPHVWKGHTTIVQEIYEHELMKNIKPDAIVTVCGGGGLVCGIAHGLELVGWGDVPIIISETVGADSFSQAVIKGEIVTLPAMTSIARTLGAKTVCKELFDLTRRYDMKSVVVTDRDAVEACARFADDHRTLVEPACGAGLSCIYNKVEPLTKILENSTNKEPTIIMFVCGGNMVTLKMLQEWKDQFSINI